MSNKKLNICMVSDFFFPKLGGVEMHIHQLALCLIEQGHKVIVMTRTYGNRQGIRFLSGGIKVYHLPVMSLIADSVIAPSFFGNLPLMRQIFIREQIDIVHGHQASSVLQQEAIINANNMGYKVVYTDHSLFGFTDAAGINLSKVMKFYLTDIDHAISVSHTSRENLSLRACLPPQKISAIPNAVDSFRFTPDPSKRYPLNKINIVIVSRLTFRKGIDFLVDIIPAMCQKYQEVYFIIGGDGDKRPILEQMIEKNFLKDRVEMLGSVPSKNVRDVLVRGHIFLNTSLTEAFCIAIVEAASCGLLVVSTDVGGVTEVLPHDMIFLAKPDPKIIIEQLEAAIPQCYNIPSHQFHQRVKNMYNWKKVSIRTNQVYQSIMKQPKKSFQEKLKNQYANGPISGFFICILMSIHFLFYMLLSVIQPCNSIDKAVNFPHEKYKQNTYNYGDHSFKVIQNKKQ